MWDMANSNTYWLPQDHSDVMRVTYDTWKPFFYGSDESNFGGLMYFILRLVAQRHNLTLEWVPNEEPGQWGVRQPNGSWNGMVSMLMTGTADVAAPGFVATPERSEVMDLSLPVISTPYQLFMQSTSRSSVSLQNYLYEFDMHTWSAILAASMSLIMAFAVVMLAKKLNNVVSTSTSMVLRALVYKGSHFPSSRDNSLKILILVNLFFATVVVTSYRSCMNAFLTVTRPVVEVRNLEDVLSTGRSITMWGGGSTEQFFASTAEGSAERELYQKYKEDDRAHVRSFHEGLELVAEDDGYVMLGPSNLAAGLPCHVTSVPGFVAFQNHVTFALTLNSRFSRLLDSEILEMKQRGVVDRLMGAHHEGGSHCGDEDDGSVALTFNNVFTPFAILAAGVAAGISCTVAEHFCHKLHKSHFAHKLNSRQEGDEDEEASARRQISKFRAIIEKRGLGPRERLDLLKRTLQQSPQV